MTCVSIAMLSWFKFAREIYSNSRNFSDRTSVVLVAAMQAELAAPRTNHTPFGSAISHAHPLALSVPVTPALPSPAGITPTPTRHTHAKKRRVTDGRCPQLQPEAAAHPRTPTMTTTHEARGDVAEVDDVPDGRQVVGAHVLVLQVVRVLPDVDAELQPRARWVVGEQWRSWWWTARLLTWRAAG